MTCGPKMGRGVIIEFPPFSPASVVASERELSGRTEAAPAGDVDGERLRGGPEPVV
jgi:hypothetical protein